MSSASPYRDEDVRRPFASVAAGQTDAELHPAETGRKLRLLSVQALATAATALTFNRKPSGSGVAISATFTSANGVPTADLAYNPHGWFETRAGEALTVTTGAGQTTQISAVIVSLYGGDSHHLLDSLGLSLLLEDDTPLLLESA